MEAARFDAEGPAGLLLLLLFMALAVLGPFMLSAVLRSLTHMRIALALAVAILVCYAAAVVFIDWARLGMLLRRATLFDYPLALLPAAALVTATCWLLANRYVGGLSYYRGTDGSWHAYYVDQWAWFSPAIYDGCTIFYAVSFWFEKLFHVNRFFGFVFGFYSQIALTAFITILMAAYAVSDARRRWSQSLLFLVILLLLGAIEMVALLPNQHIFQTDGFFPQSFALFPLFLIWAADALIVGQVPRTIGVLLTIAFYRYTYALNLPDMLAAFMVLQLVEMFRDRDESRRLWAWTGLAVVAWFFAVKAFYFIWRVHKMNGHFLEFDWLHAGLGQGLAIATLIACYYVARPGSRLRRLCRLPIWFGIINLGLTLTVRFMPPGGFYYGDKYPFHGFMLVGSAVAIAVPAAAREAWERFRSLFSRIAVALPLLAAAAEVTNLWYDGFFPYQKGFIERAFLEPPYTENSPLADLGAIPRIQAVLKKEKKSFGGFLNTNFGMMMFMNAALGHPYWDWEIWFQKALYPEAGRCIFWDEGSTEAWPVWEAWCAQKDIRARLRFSTDKTCLHYTTHWNPEGTPRRLCYRCQ
jgi:hypothetical protein